MITIEYCEEGNPVSDFHCRLFVDNVKCLIENGNQDYTIKTSTNLVLDFLRLAIIKEEINYKDVVVKFKGQIIEFDVDGLLKKYPEGLGDIASEVCLKYLELSVNKGKTK